MISGAESRVVAYLQQGLSNKEIGEALFVCEKTVKFHLTNIYKAYEVKSRSELLAKLTGFGKTEREEIMVELVPGANKSAAITQQEKIKFIDTQFRVGESIEHLHTMMKSVTKDAINPATVNAACNCVARLNETINTAIQAAKFLNER